MISAATEKRTWLGGLLGGDWDTLSATLKSYILFFCALGVVTLAWCLRDPELVITQELLILLIVSALIGPRTVSMGYTTNTSIELLVSHPLVFTAIITLGPTEAVLVSEVALLSGLLTTQRHMKFYRALFNVGTFACTTLLAGMTYYGLAGDPNDFASSQGIVALLASLLVYYAINTATISIAVSLYNRAALYRTWRENFLWSAPSHFAGGSIALGMAYFIQQFGIISLVLVLPFCILIYYSYKLYMDRLFEERRHSEQIQNVNLELERKVQERTRELEALNEKLQGSNLELQRVSLMKSEFLANMSHELRTPLNAIIGFSELLMDQTFGQLNDAQSDYVDDILGSGRHLLELINDILDLSKVEAGKMDLRPEVFGVSQLVEEAMSTLQIAAGRKKIDLGNQVPGDLPEFSGDRGKIKQILHNLLSNAIKFTPEGGRVWLRCGMKGAELEVSVCDTGIGIRKEDQERIFEAFMQADGSYSRKYQGTGLGLTLVKQFVELHRGRLEVVSEPGKGSRFTFWLPNAAPRQESGAAARLEATLPHPQPLSLTAGDPGGRRDLILVVEDNPANMRLISELLRARGFTILEAVNAEEALSRIRRIKPHLILMDLQLPGMDGLACTRELKRDPRTADIPTVALTAHAMKGDEERAREAGCVGYITKPINTAEFARQIEGYLKQDEAVSRV